MWRLCDFLIWGHFGVAQFSEWQLLECHSKMTVTNKEKKQNWAWWIWQVSCFRIIRLELTACCFCCGYWNLKKIPQGTKWYIFLTISNHSQTYQNYQQPPQRFQNCVIFQCWKSVGSFSIIFLWLKLRQETIIFY